MYIFTMDHRNLQAAPVGCLRFPIRKYAYQSSSESDWFASSLTERGRPRSCWALWALRAHWPQASRSRPNAPSACILYILCIHSVYTLYTLCIYRVYTQQILRIYSVYTVYIQSIHSVYTLHTFRIYYVYTLYVLCVYSVYTLYVPRIY